MVWGKNFSDFFLFFYREERSWFPERGWRWGNFWERLSGEQEGFERHGKFEGTNIWGNCASSPHSTRPFPCWAFLTALPLCKCVSPTAPAVLHTSTNPLKVWTPHPYCAVPICPTIRQGTEVNGREGGCRQAPNLERCLGEQSFLLLLPGEAPQERARAAFHSSFVLPPIPNLP